MCLSFCKLLQWIDIFILHGIVILERGKLMKKKLLLVLAIIGILTFSTFVYADDIPTGEPEDPVPVAPVPGKDDTPFVCYKCNDSFKWAEEGSVGSECTKDATITEKSKCVANPDTGVTDYAVGIVSVIAIAGVSYYLVKKNSMFN